MQIFNLMTCSAPPHTWSTSLMGGCSQAWLVLGLLFLLVMILRRQTDDGIMAGVSYNVFGAGILGLGVAIVLATLFGQARWEFLGLVGIAIGGFGLGLIGIGEGGSE